MSACNLPQLQSCCPPTRNVNVRGFNNTLATAIIPSATTATSDPVRTSQHRTSFHSTVLSQNWTPSNSNLLFNLKLLVSQETRFIWVHINKLSAIVRVVRRSAERVYSPGFLRRCCGHQALSSGHDSTRVKCQKCPIKPSTNNQSWTEHSNFGMTMGPGSMAFFWRH